MFIKKKICEINAEKVNFKISDLFNKCAIIMFVSFQVSQTMTRGGPRSQIAIPAQVHSRIMYIKH